MCTPIEVLNYDKLLRHLLNKLYYSMFTSRGGFNEFYIWRENFDDRRSANLKLDKVNGKLKKIL